VAVATGISPVDLLDTDMEIFGEMVDMLAERNE
jgi:hypothetical protein